MKWEYKMDNALRFFLQRRLRLREFLLMLSWEYAHYRNGHGPTSYKGAFRTESFVQRVQRIWRMSRFDDY